MALQDLPQPIDHACSSEHLPDTVGIEGGQINGREFLPNVAIL